MPLRLMLKIKLAALIFLLSISSAQALDIKIATIAPDGTTWMQEMRRGASEIAQRSEGRVIFKFYPGGAMGSDKNVLRKIRAGQLQGGALTGGGLAEVYPDNQIYNLPLVFRSYEELDYVRSKMDALITQGLEQRGFISFGLAEGGFAYLMASHSIRNIDDLKHEKVWTPEGDTISRSIYQAMGVSPIPLPLTDVLTGLQTGLITTIGGSPTGAIALQWHTKLKYVTDVPLMYFYGMLAVDRKVYLKMNPSDQTLVREVMQDVFDKLNRRTRQDNENARKALRQQGVEFVQLAPSEMEKLRQAANTAVIQLGTQGVYTPDMFKTLQGHLENYRKQPAKTPAQR